ncbi:MAG: ATP-binding cassette domain-containing protein [Sphaerospermopsis sp. SIO1G2]|nr:ATP-binding cassette domain-containing protein [Sphaerospermopsis sp. SIO1G2]
MFKKNILLRFARPYPGLILITILLGFSGALFNGVSTALIVPVILKIIGQEVNLKGGPGILQFIISPFDNLPETYRAGAMAGAILGIIALKNLATYSSSLMSSTLTRMIVSDMRETGVDILLKVDIDYYNKMKIGDLINRLGAEINKASGFINNGIRLVSLVITILVFVVLLLSISWQLTIAATPVMMTLVFINQYFINQSKKFGKEISEFSKLYSIAVIEVLNGVRLVKSTSNESKEYEKISNLIRVREKSDFKAQANSQAISPLSEVIGIACLMMIVFLSKNLFAEQLALVSTILLTYLVLLLRLLPLISQLNNIRSSFAVISASMDIVGDFLRRDNKTFMPNGTLIYTRLQTGIHFNNISFQYPNHERQILKDVDLYLPRGQTLALVGGSGAGKSTLADLLPRFYDPSSGCIAFDDTDLREFDLASVRKNMGIVSQDTFLFNDSVRNNIAYSQPDATEEEIITAARLANAYEFINKLPQQFDTIIGDRGVMLSGGQKQRLAIARALLQNPEILILDEATSALDTVSERLVQSAIDQLSRDRTTLVIAHRLSTVRKADKIAVLDQGRVVETGTHEELLQKGGYYSQLHSMQFAKNTNTVSNHNQSLLRISYEIRTQLNSLIGLLQLLIDNLVDNDQEHQELLEQCYKSAWRIINTIDVFEDVINHQLKGELVAIAEQNNSSITTYYQKFSYIFDEFRSRLNPTLACLRTVADNEANSYESQNQLLQEAHESSIYLLGNLQKFEDSIKI